MASAVSYVAAQLNLFADVSEFVSRGKSDMEPLLASLRRAVETDRYGWSPMCWRPATAARRSNARRWR